MVFTEEGCGTNAIDLSICLNRPVYTFPNHHYCEFLRKIHLYSIPLYVSSASPGCLAVASVQKGMSRETVAIADLLAYQIANEYRNASYLSKSTEKRRVMLTSKQIRIMRLLMTGMTDRAISVETGLSFATVRYHKNNIFRKLDAGCTVEAVIKALKLKLVSLEDVFC